jgi:hypothetical protein
MLRPAAGNTDYLDRLVLTGSLQEPFRERIRRSGAGRTQSHE